jgi:hypothetical protein
MASQPPKGPRKGPLAGIKAAGLPAPQTPRKNLFFMGMR